MKNKKLANRLRKELLKNVEIKTIQQKVDLAEAEYISQTEQPYVSPIFTMTEDEILAFVESFEVAELATLSVAELNRLGEVLGVEPSILTQGVN